jgi:hypothetical protein
MIACLKTDRRHGRMNYKDTVGVKLCCRPYSAGV